MMWMVAHHVAYEVPCPKLTLRLLHNLVLRCNTLHLQKGGQAVVLHSTHARRRYIVRHVPPRMVVCCRCDIAPRRSAMQSRIEINANMEDGVGILNA